MSVCLSGSDLPGDATQNAGVLEHAVLWISRAKFEITHELSDWQMERVLSNEADVIRMMQVDIQTAR
jgi:hypothetical protein